jgi:hypothetical protein
VQGARCLVLTACRPKNHHVASGIPVLHQPPLAAHAPQQNCPGAHMHTRAIIEPNPDSIDATMQQHNYSNITSGGLPHNNTVVHVCTNQPLGASNYRCKGSLGT